MTLRLIIEQSNHAQQVQEIRHAYGELSIGRGAECGWQLDDPDMYVSRKHCVISGGDGSWQATDASRGGLFVDGANQPLGPGNSVALANGMRLRLGDVVIRVEVEAPRQPLAGLPQAGTGRMDGDDFFSRPVASVPNLPRPDGMPQPFEQARAAALSVAPGSAASSPRTRPPVLFDDPFSMDPLPTGGLPSDPLAAGSQPAGSPAPGRQRDFTDPFTDPFSAPPRAQPPAPLQTARPAEPKAPARPAETDSDFSFGSFFGGPEAAAPPPKPKAPEPDDWSLPPVEPALLRAVPFPERPMPEPPAAGPTYFASAAGDPRPVPPIQPEPERERVRETRQAVPATRLIVPAEPMPDPAPAYAPAQFGDPPEALGQGQPGAGKDGPPMAASDEGMQAFLRGLGLAPEAIAAGFGPTSFGPDSFGPAEMEAMGRRFRLMTEGLIQMLRTRAREKNDARLSQTIIGSANVNPIKFLAGTDEVVASLLSHRGPGYMKPDDAISGALRDLAEHQMRSWVGLQAALRQMIDRFDPARIESELEETGGLRSLLAGGRSARLWQLYTEQFKEIAKAAEDQFLGDVGADYRDAYLGQQQEGKT